MIWFTCGACKKVHGRAENAAGSMIFCTCGQGVVVPWESTAPAPAIAADAPAVPKVARVEPLSFGGPSRPEPVQPLPPPRPRGRTSKRQVDPNRCFTHDERTKQKLCEECELPFCEECVVIFRGRTICGPCKNYEAKLLQRPPRLSGLAVLSLLLGFVAGVLVLVTALAGPGRGYIIMMALAGVMQAATLALGLRALHKTHGDPRLAGQGAALTAVTTAVFTAALALVAVLYHHKPWV